MTSLLKQNSADFARLPGETREENLQRIINAAVVFRLTDEENLQILKDLSKGIEEFLWQEKKIAAATLLESRIPFTPV